MSKEPEQSEKPSLIQRLRRGLPDHPVVNFFFYGNTSPMQRVPQEQRFAVEAMGVLIGFSGYLSLLPDLQNERVADLEMNGKSILAAIYQRIQQASGTEAAGVFAQMIGDMPVVNERRVALGVFALAHRDWQYDEELQNLVLQEETLLSPEQEAVIYNRYPDLRRNLTTFDPITNLEEKRLQALLDSHMLTTEIHSPKRDDDLIASQGVKERFFSAINKQYNQPPHNKPSKE